MPRMSSPMPIGPRRTAQSYRAEIIAVGSELLVGGRLDSNSLFIAEQLGRLGIAVRFKTVVGDPRRDIVVAIETAVTRVGIIIMTGGLGPTIDDCTREAVAQATRKRLSRRKEATDMVVARLAQWGRTPSPAQMRQTMIPSGATVLANPVGSAPGFCLEWKQSWLAALPGVPQEMEPMVTQGVVPILQARLTKAGLLPNQIVRHVFHTVGLPEADVDVKLKGLIPHGVPIDLGLLASPIGVLVSLTTQGGGRGPTDEGTLAPYAKEIRIRLGDWLFAEGAETMEGLVGEALTDQGLTLAVAESCTGGLIGHRLTQVPGSSAYIDRIAVCYSNRAKIEMLGVPADLVAKHGAVSAEVVAAMACGVRERSHVSVGLAVTGIAGPGGATATKPVGLVYIGLDGGTGHPTTKEYRFSGDRSVVKQRAAQAALDLLRRWLRERAKR